MNGSKPPLHAHLLTRTDLAAMAIPAATVLRWLAEGLIEEVGTMPAAADIGEPVFTVPDDDLRRQLQEKLAALGKPAVVLTPVGVRSFLLRALLPDRDPPAAAVAGGESLPATPLATADLATVLQEAANDVVADVETMLRLAAEIAATEASAPTPREDDAVAAAAAIEPDADVDDEHDLQSTDATDEAVFDFDALAEEFAEQAEDRRAHEPSADPGDAGSATPLAAPADDDGDGGSEPSGAGAPPAELAPAGTTADAAPPPARSDQPSETAATAEAAPTGAPPGDARLHEFLGAIEQALIEVAQRPATQRIDIEPLVTAMQTGFEHAARQAADASSTLSALNERLSRFGDQVERGVAQTVQTVLDRSAAARPAAAHAPQPAFVGSGNRHGSFVLAALAMLSIAWAIVFWLKTGSPRLALAALIAANAVGCCLLIARPERS